MEQNKNNRLDDLFNQAKNEPSKVSYEETKKQFLKSSAGITSSGAGQGVASISNLKIIIMIATISIITVGSIMLLNTFSSDEVAKKENSVSMEPLADSAFIIQEHEKVVEEYLDNIELEMKEFVTKGSMIEPLNNKIVVEEPKESNPINNEKHSYRKKKIGIDTSFVFPVLNAQERKDQRKRKANMLKISNKREAYGFVFIPSGNLNVNGETISVQSFEMKQTEVTNAQYRTFLFDLLAQGRKEAFLIAKPDQSRWMKDYPNSFNKPMQDNYFSHPAYDEYPVVAISRKGAEMYCDWLTEEINKVLIAKSKTPINDVRLPTNEEWMIAAKGGKDEYVYPWGGPYLRNSKGCFLANFKPGEGKGCLGLQSKTKDDVKLNEKSQKNSYSADGGFFTVKASSYNPNDYGLYCMSGNAAEMVSYSDGSVGTKGGSWTSEGQELQIVDGKDRFRGLTKASVNVGFRPVISFLNTKGAKDNSITPPGTKRINASLYMDETEVTNFMWQEYVFWVGEKHGKDSEAYVSVQSDSTVWRSEKGFNEPYVEYYLTHPAYRNYPVIGITYEQAVAYCKWRTDRVKELYKIRKEAGDKKNVYPTHFEYRLPSKIEWERIASVGYSEKIQKKLDGKYKGQHRSNLKIKEGDKRGVADELNNSADVTAPVTAYWPNKYGIYNMHGNVAEMISEKGIAKGGAWVHDEEYASSIEKDYPYKKQNSWVGFRCVLELKD